MSFPLTVTAGDIVAPLVVALGCCTNANLSATTSILLSSSVVLSEMAPPPSAAAN